MEQTTTPFSVLLSRIRAGEGTSTLEVPEDWLQGRTLFGGLQAVVGLAAMRSLAPDAPLRSLQVTFLAPVPGGPVTARARILRSGKSATHVEARIVDGDNTLALMVGVFGLPRTSAVTLRPQQPSVVSEKPAELHPVAASNERRRAESARTMRSPFAGDPSTPRCSRYPSFDSSAIRRFA